jgi:hypothetical protein
MGATASGPGWTCASRIPSASREAAAATPAAAASTPPSPRTRRGASGPPSRYRRAQPVSFPTDAQKRVSCVSLVVSCAGAQVLAGVVVRGEAAIPERGRGGELVLGLSVERHIRVQPVVDALPGLLLLPALPASPATGTSSIPRNYFNLF